MNTLAIIQARMSSSRLPGKVLLDLAGQPMLGRVIERTRRARRLSGIVVATTSDPSDDPIAGLCAERAYPCYRGSLHDVLDRYYQAARAFDADVIVRITADCPVIDPQVVDRTIEAFWGVGFSHHEPSSNTQAAADFAANRLPPPWGRTLPIGLDTEVCSYAALERAWQEAHQPFHREHVMPYFYEGIPQSELHPLQDSASRPPEPWQVVRSLSPRGFRVAQLHHWPDYGHLRWTVDTPADLELLRRVYEHFAGRDDFSWMEILTLFENDPSLAAINADVQHKTAFDVDTRSPAPKGKA